MSTTTESTDTSYLIKFDRIGRYYDVAPLVAKVRDDVQLSAVIHTYLTSQYCDTRPLLPSDVEVVANLDKQLGLIVSGSHCAGSFTITPLPLTSVQLLRAAAEVVGRGPTRDYYERAAADHQRNDGVCPAGITCWFEKQARDELAAAGRSVTA